jgi:hypothetical protein
MIELKVITGFVTCMYDNFQCLGCVLSGACYAVRSMLHVSNTDTLKSVHFDCFHSIMNYGIISWGNSSNSKKIFTKQKKIVRLMAVSNLEIHVEAYLRD